MTQKYEMPVADAEAIADFLKPMFTFDPEARATAASALKHPWVRTPCVRYYH